VDSGDKGKKVRLEACVFVKCLPPRCMYFTKFEVVVSENISSNDGTCAPYSVEIYLHALIPFMTCYWASLLMMPRIWKALDLEYCLLHLLFALSLFVVFLSLFFQVNIQNYSTMFNISSRLRVVKYNTSKRTVFSSECSEVVTGRLRRIYMPTAGG
jgi:hypothetical protein